MAKVPDLASAARTLGRLGGKARAEKNSAARLTEIGRAGSDARWAGHVKPTKAKPPTASEAKVAASTLGRRR